MVDALPLLERQRRHALSLGCAGALQHICRDALVRHADLDARQNNDVSVCLFPVVEIVVAGGVVCVRGGDLES